MKKEDFVAEMNEEPERRTVIMNGEEMELGDDGEYHVINKRQFGRLSKLHAIGACIAGLCVVVGLTIALLGLLSDSAGSKPLSEMADDCGFSDDSNWSRVDDEDPEIITLSPDEVDTAFSHSNTDVRPKKSYKTDDDLDVPKPEPYDASKDPSLDPADSPKDPEVAPTNDDSLYVLTIRFVNAHSGAEIYPPRVVQGYTGDSYSESVPTIAGYESSVSQVEGTMASHDSTYTVYYRALPGDPPSPDDSPLN